MLTCRTNRSWGREWRGAQVAGTHRLVGCRGRARGHWARRRRAAAPHRRARRRHRRGARPGADHARLWLQQRRARAARGSAGRAGTPRAARGRRAALAAPRPRARPVAVAQRAAAPARRPRAAARQRRPALRAGQPAGRPAAARGADAHRAAARRRRARRPPPPPPPVAAHMTGYIDIADAIHGETVKSIERAELIAAPVLLIILLLVLGSPIAAGVRMALGGAVVAAAGGVLDLVNRVH